MDELLREIDLVVASKLPLEVKRERVLRLAVDHDTARIVIEALVIKLHVAVHTAGGAG